MMTGPICGARAREGAGTPWSPLSVFLKDEGGYTSVSMAVALLVSLSLVFAAASTQWITSRAAEVQEVADACALAGSNSVAAFSTVAQVLDACVLSMGLAGMVSLGAGLVASCVPGMAGGATALVDSGSKLLETRRNFAKSAAQGLERLETILPGVVIANSVSCASANSKEGLAYSGCAVPFPLESQSDYSSLMTDADDSGIKDLSKKLQDLSSRSAEAKQRASAAKLRAWMADCVADPYCLRERAQRLAGLEGTLNPQYASVDNWTFGAALSRARNYYAARSASCVVAGSDPEELTDAACRKVFYDFALEEVRAATYRENADGTITANFPEFPRNTQEMRESALYTRKVWPCTAGESGAVMHSSLLCPAAGSAATGYISLAEFEAGAAQACATCQMDAVDMGSVAAATTSTSSGFEHYWQIVVDASREYTQAMEDYAKTQDDLKDVAQEGKQAFKDALDSLGTLRPKICPPGAWGCISLVTRDAGTAVPNKLTGAFLTAAELPSGIAISGAALAPDATTQDNNVLASFLDGLDAQDSLFVGMADGVATLWSNLLLSYGAAYDKVGSVGSDFLDKVDGVLGGSAGSWLKGKIKDVMGRLGLEPCDLRLRKPVLVNTSKILAKAGYEKDQTLRQLLNSLPDNGTAYDYARAFGIWLVDELDLKEVTVAEISIPGTSITIPLKVDLAKLLGDSS